MVGSPWLVDTGLEGHGNDDDAPNDADERRRYWEEYQYCLLQRR